MCWSYGGARGKRVLFKNLLCNRFEKRCSYFLSINDFDTFRVKFDEWLAQIQRLLNSHQSQTRVSVDKAAQSHQKPLQDERDDRKRELKTIRDEMFTFTLAMDRAAIDFSAHSQEIDRLKKRAYILEKYIENLYTQIDRIRKAP